MYFGEVTSDWTISPCSVTQVARCSDTDGCIVYSLDSLMLSLCALLLWQNDSKRLFQSEFMPTCPCYIRASMSFPSPCVMLESTCRLESIPEGLAMQNLPSKLLAPGAQCSLALAPGLNCIPFAFQSVFSPQGIREHLSRHIYRFMMYVCVCIHRYAHAFFGGFSIENDTSADRD